MEEKNAKLANILVAEDNEADIFLTEIMIEENNLHININFATDGEKVINYLDNPGKGTDYLMPDLIMLDIDLPKIDGKKLLRFLTEHQIYKAIPVCMLSGSLNHNDVIDSIEMGAIHFLSKPLKFNDLAKVVSGIESLEFITNPDKTLLCKV